MFHGMFSEHGGIDRGGMDSTHKESLGFNSSAHRHTTKPDWLCAPSRWIRKNEHVKGRLEAPVELGSIRPGFVSVRISETLGMASCGGMRCLPGRDLAHPAGKAFVPYGYGRTSRRFRLVPSSEPIIPGSGMVGSAEDTCLHIQTSYPKRPRALGRSPKPYGDTVRTLTVREHIQIRTNR